MTARAVRTRPRRAVIAAVVAAVLSCAAMAGCSPEGPAGTGGTDSTTATLDSDAAGGHGATGSSGTGSALPSGGAPNAGAASSGTGPPTSGPRPGASGGNGEKRSGEKRSGEGRSGNTGSADSGRTDSRGASDGAPASPSMSGRATDTRTGSGTHGSAPPTTTRPTGHPSGGALAVTAADRKSAAATVASLSVAEQAGMVIMPIASQVDGDIADQHYGGVILMGSDGVVDGTGTGSPQRVRKLVRELQGQRGTSVDAPLLIGVDQEYGVVARLVHGFTRFPGASELAEIDDTPRALRLTQRMAAAAAQEMRAVGVNVDFAPDADLLPASGSSAIGSRSYGTEAELVGRFVSAAVTGYQSGGVAATLKHFPGIGRISGDTHTELPALAADCDDWSASDRVPLHAGVDAGAALVMTGHVHFPAVGATGPPASLSHRVVTDLLRGNGYGGCSGLDYHGVTITDSLQMAPVTENYTSGEAAVRALQAGQDLLLMPLDPQAAAAGIRDAVHSGELSPGRLAAAATAVLALRLAVGRSPQPPLSVVNSAQHRELAGEITAAG